MAEVRRRQPVPTHCSCMNRLDIGGRHEESSRFKAGFGRVWLGGGVSPVVSVVEGQEWSSPAKAPADLAKVD